MDPRWSGDGRRIFYWEGNDARIPLDFVPSELVAVDLEFDPQPRPIGTTTIMPANIPSFGGAYATHYDVSPVDGRIVVVEEKERGGVARLNVVLDWMVELERRVSAEGSR